MVKRNYTLKVEVYISLADERQQYLCIGFAISTRWGDEKGDIFVTHFTDYSVRSSAFPVFNWVEIKAVCFSC